jgi:hypothetical protein
MRRLSFAPALALVLLAGPAPAWETRLAETIVEGAPDVRETRFSEVRPPAGVYDRIQVHRYRGEGAPKAVLLYLPGTNMNGEIAVRDERHNLWLYLARRGVEVWALDYRTHFVPPSEPEAGGHAYMADWDLETFVEDARAAAALARERSGRSDLFVAGFSRGVTLAFGVACSEPRVGVAGLVVLDGTFKSKSPEQSYDFDTAWQKLRADGSYSTDVARAIGWENRHRLMSAAAADPKSPSANLEHASVGDEVATLLYGAWRPGALADPVNGVSRVEVLARLLDGYDRYWPAIQNAEGTSIASRADDPRTPIDDRWGELSLPILYFGATGMGEQWILDGVHSVAESGSEDVTVHLLEGYGHLDVLVGERAAEDVFAVVHGWMLERSARE